MAQQCASSQGKHAYPHHRRIRSKEQEGGETIQSERNDKAAGTSIAVGNIPRSEFCRIRASRFYAQISHRFQ